MRSILVIAVAAFLTSVTASAQQQQPKKTDTEGLSCFENLTAPEFPQTALHSHIDGSVWTWTHVSPQGTIDKIDTQVVSPWGTGPKILTPPVEKAIRAARIKSNCDGKTIWVVFTYQLHGDATPAPKVTSRTEPPNIMWIESQPATTTVTASRRKS